MFAKRQDRLLQLIHHLWICRTPLPKIILTLPHDTSEQMYCQTHQITTRGTINTFLRSKDFHQCLTSQNKKQFRRHTNPKQSLMSWTKPALTKYAAYVWWVKKNSTASRNLSCLLFLHCNFRLIIHFPWKKQKPMHEVELLHFLECSHVFHTRCIAQWVAHCELHILCPLCRQTITHGSVACFSNAFPGSRHGPQHQDTTWTSCFQIHARVSKNPQKMAKNRPKWLISRGFFSTWGNSRGVQNRGKTSHFWQ